ncbi:MAG: pyrroline-5-carboxylate reductase [Deltaproteobacteria bacterium]|nr:pyrroline-5-carboxylate reductase [Deltaproteobacteria bacterium]
MNIAIIGGGNMGGAFARACLEKKLCSAKSLYIVEPLAARRAELFKQLGCRIEAAPSQTLKKYPIVFLAVKPFEMSAVCKSLSPYLGAKHLVISILAGIRIASISKALAGHKNIIRCMPNTPVQLGLGMSVFYSAPVVKERDLNVARTIFEAVGASLQVDKESLVDAATAVSGSGPAYLYYYIENMLKAAQRLGFSDIESELLVGQTITGALALWGASGESPECLRERVTSKGGTTAAALGVFQKKKVGAALIEGVKRADERCRELQKLAK